MTDGYAPPAPASTFDRRRCFGLSPSASVQEDAGRRLAVKRCEPDSLLFASVVVAAPRSAVAEEASVSL